MRRPLHAPHLNGLKPDLSFGGEKAKHKGRLAGMKQFTRVIMTEIAAIRIGLTLQRLYTINPSGSPSSTMAVV
jgi:hypothetical protein